MIFSNLRSLIFVFLFSIVSSYGQQATEAISIDDICPDVYVPNIVNFPPKTVKLSQFKGKELLLDFWATWCGACVSSFPKLDSLQKKYSDRLQVLLITKEGSSLADPFLRGLKKLKGIDLPSVVEDSVLSVLFTHKYLPHYVWIDRNGVVRAITGSEEVTDVNISDFVNGKKLGLNAKIDKKLYFDRSKPVFAGNQRSIDQSFLYNSVLTRHVQDLPTESISRDTYIECLNHPIRLLYQLAFGQFNLDLLGGNRIILEGFVDSFDSIKVGIYKKGALSFWKKNREKNVYCYELAFGDMSYSREDRFKIMQDDLNRNFSKIGIVGGLEKRKSYVWSLIRISKQDKIKTKGGSTGVFYLGNKLEIINKPIFFFISKLQSSLSDSGDFPVENETGYSNNVDIAVNADLRDIEAVNRELSKYDLKIVKTEKVIDMIVIRKMKPLL